MKVSEKENTERLKLYKQGLSDGSIGRKLGLSQPTICLWRQKHGLSSTYKGGEHSQKQVLKENQLILRMYKRGKSEAEIISTLGLAQSKRGYTPRRRVGIVIGRHLMNLCRQEPSCPLKALLPENAC